MDGAIPLDSHVVDYISAVVCEAIRGADRVAAFLRELGIAPAVGGNPIALSPELLQGLDLALRFANWEANHIFVHVDAGLPRGEELLRKVVSLGRGAELQVIVTDLSVKSLQLLAQHFSWTVGVEIQA